MIQVIRQTNGREASIEIPIDQLSEVVAHHDAAVWVNVVDATPEEIARVGAEFGLHPLALEDTVRGGQRPKFEQYDGYRFIVFYGLSTADDGRPQTHEVDIFVGGHVMVTFHRGQLRVVAETADRWRANVASLGDSGVGFLLYSLLDALVDGYFPVLDAVAERTEGLEETVFVRGQRGFQAEILQLRRDLLMIRRVAGPERDVLNELVRRDPPLFSQHEVVYFQDVYDHLLRITDTVDLYRDMLSSVLDANLSIISYNLNEVVRRLTSSSIILMSMALIAGIYGMNFVYMPELRWPWGYPFALLLMAAVAAIEVAVFRRIGWL